MGTGSRGLGVDPVVVGPSVHPLPTPEMPSPALWAGPKAQVESGTGKEEAPAAGPWVARSLLCLLLDLPEPPLQPPNSSVDPHVLHTSPSPHRCGLCIQGPDPPAKCPAPPHPLRHPGSPRTPSWVPQPGASTEPTPQGFRSQVPTTCPRHPVPDCQVQRSGQQDPPSQANEELLSPSRPGRLLNSGERSTSAGKNKQQAYCCHNGKSWAFLSAAFIAAGRAAAEHGRGLQPGCTSEADPPHPPRGPGPWGCGIYHPGL